MSKGWNWAELISRINEPDIIETATELIDERGLDSILVALRVVCSTITSAPSGIQVTPPIIAVMEEFFSGDREALIAWLVWLIAPDGFDGDRVGYLLHQCAWSTQMVRDQEGRNN